MSIIKGLLDRVCFTLGVLLFMQVPHFIDQYTQRLGGYYQAQLGHLSQYQEIAKKQHHGDLELLIQEFESSSRAAVQETGKNIRNIRDNSALLAKEVNVLENKAFVFKLTQIFTGMRYDLAKETLKTYKVGVPLSVEGLICGLLGGVLMSLIFNGCCLFPKLLKPSPTQVQKTSTMRIEPSVTRSKRAR